MKPLSFLSKLMIFTIAVSTLPVLFIGTFSYLTSTREIQKNVNRSKIELISQINSNVERKLTTVNQTLNQVVNSTVLKRALQNPLSESDFKLYNDLRNEIRNMQSFDTKLEDVVLMNLQQDWMVKNSGLYRMSEYKDREGLEQLMDTPNDTTWMLTPSSWFYSEENADSAPCHYSISLIKKLPVSSLHKYGLALANFPACSLQDVVATDVQTEDLVIVADEHGQILMHPDPSWIGRQLGETGWEDTSLLADETHPSGQFQTHIGKKAYAVTYLRSQLNGWMYLSVTSIGSLTREAGKIGLFTFYVCLFMLVLSVGLAWFGSRRMYSPIERLLHLIGRRKTDVRRTHADEFELIGEEYDRLFQSKSQLETEVRQHIRQVRAFSLIEAFQGRYTKSQLLEKLEQYGYQEQIRAWRTMTVFTLALDFTEDSAYGKKDLNLLLFAAQNIIEELLDPRSRFTPVIMDQTIVTLIGSAEEEPDSFHQTVYTWTEKLQHEIHLCLKVHVSIGLSLSFQSISKLPIAYREGMEALKYRMKLGTGVIIQYENLNSGKHVLNVNYPTHKENELLDAIKLAETEKAKEVNARLFNSMFNQELTPQEYQIPLTRLLNNLLVMMQEAGIALHQIRPAGSGSLFEEMFGLHTKAEIEDWFWTTVIHPMIRIFHNRQNAQYQNISEKIIDLIHHEYDTDLTLEACAARLHYNANYISSIFRKETGCSFSEYLTMYRFKMAKEWLRNTEMPVKEIAAKLRYNNSQNFIRSFRKIEGMTPGQYREGAAAHSPGSIRKSM